MEPEPDSVRPKIVRHLLAATLLALMTACAGSPPSVPSAAHQKDLDLQGQWALASADIEGRDLNSPVDAHLTLVFSESGNQAHAGCSVNVLEPDVSGNSLTLRVTEMGNMRSCPPRTAQGGWDQKYLHAVAAVDHGERSGQTLTLTGPEVTLTFIEQG